MTWPSGPIQPKYSPRFEADAAAGPDALRHAVHRHHAAPRHHPAEAWLVGAEMLRADGRPDAVGADDEHRLRRSLPSAKRATAAPLTVSAPTQLALSRSGVSPTRRAQQVMDIGAMRRHIGRAVLRRAIAFSGARNRSRASSQVSETMLIGSNALRRSASSRPSARKHLDTSSVRSEVRRRPLRAWRALVERNLDAALAQRAGGGKPADAGADDGDPKRSFCGVGDIIVFLTGNCLIGRTVIAMAPVIARSQRVRPEWPAR